MKGSPNDPIKVLLLTIVTCGIYGLFWIYKTRGEMKSYLEDSAISPEQDIILSIICFPYMVYLWYKMGNDLIRMQKKAGIPEKDNSTIFLILAVCGLVIVDIFIAQEQLNGIWNAE